MIQLNCIPPIFNSSACSFQLPALNQVSTPLFQYMPFGSVTSNPYIPFVNPVSQGISSASNPFGGWFNFSLPTFTNFSFPTFNYGSLLNNTKTTASNLYNRAKSTFSSVSSKISNFASRIISGAKKYLGYKESDGSYKKFTNGRREAWCAHFATYVAREKGSSIPHFSSVSQILHWGRQNNKFSTTAKAGDIIIFKGVDKNGKQVSHTGIVTKVQNGKVYTVEGNTSRAVKERAYALNDSKITGYVTVG